MAETPEFVVEFTCQGNTIWTDYSVHAADAEAAMQKSKLQLYNLLDTPLFVNVIARNHPLEVYAFPRAQLGYQR